MIIRLIKTPTANSGFKKWRGKGFIWNEKVF